MGLNAAPGRRPWRALGFAATCSLRNRWIRVRKRHAGWRSLCIAALVVVAGALAASALTDVLRAVILQSDSLWGTPAGFLAAGTITLLGSTHLTVVRYRRSALRLAQFWLASTQAFDPLSWRWRCLLAAGPPALAGLMLFPALASIAAMAGAEALRSLATAAATGTLIGTGTGLLFAMKPIRSQPPASRYLLSGVSRRLQGDASTGQPAGAHAFTVWPILQAQAWARPDNSRLLFLAALTLMPAGLAGIVVLALLLTWLLAVWLLATTLAMPVVARQARDWLQSTPLSWPRFCWLCMRRVLLHQVWGCLAAAGLMRAFDASAADALRLLIPWLILFALFAVTSLSAAWRGRGGLWLAAAATTSAVAIENRFAGTGPWLALFLGTIAWQAGARHERS